MELKDLRFGDVLKTNEHIVKLHYAENTENGAFRLHCFWGVCTADGSSDSFENDYIDVLPGNIARIRSANESRCSVCKYKEGDLVECYNCVGLGTRFVPDERLKNLMLLNGWQCTQTIPTRIVLGFPGVGKTYVKEKYKGTSVKVLDSDSSNFDKSSFPGNYIEYIKSCIGKFDLILISTHEAVRKAIASSDIMDRAVVSICYPSLDLKEDWIQRLANRGNGEQFLSLVRENYDQWIKDIESEDWFYKEVLDEKDSYLSGILYRIGL